MAARRCSTACLTRAVASLPTAVPRQRANTTRSSASGPVACWARWGPGRPKAQVPYFAATALSTDAPHVAVAHQLGQRRGRIAYVITTAGPQPADRHGPLDYGHDLEKQVGAVASRVQALLRLDFDEILGSRKQLRQF